LSPFHATCRTYLILLDLITRIIFGEEYKLRACTRKIPKVIRSGLAGGLSIRPPPSNPFIMTLNSQHVKSDDNNWTGLRPFVKQLQLLSLSLSSVCCKKNYLNAVSLNGAL
jgi:hypothetical protein